VAEETLGKGMQKGPVRRSGAFFGTCDRRSLARDAFQFFLLVRIEATFNSIQGEGCLRSSLFLAITHPLNNFFCLNGIFGFCCWRDASELRALPSAKQGTLHKVLQSFIRTTNGGICENITGLNIKQFHATMLWQSPTKYGKFRPFEEAGIFNKFCNALQTLNSCQC
jgi:hypothetical protein